MQPSKFELILAQVFISGTMAFLMTGVFGPLFHGFPHGWLSNWISHYLMAWPIAFLFSLMVGPLSFWMAKKIAGGTISVIVKADQ